ncbi:MAG: beta-hydroxyacid dehydrogenase, 3-hydroxyisobutyrate dehydrogenase [Firmicutes bacterium]|nr:beta-hydroxyacid dehydrogenase, 3-hydroxyisobutyrate dehydrogenase [Bacillota bacterium]
MKVGFIGLGAMGKPMALNLLKAGHLLVVNDVNAKAVEELILAGAKKAESPKLLAEQVEVVITMLPNGGIVEQVLLGEQGVLAGAGDGFGIIDMSSVAPGFTQKMARLAAQTGVCYLDAPVSGGVKGAAEGTLTIMVGGDEQALARYQGLFQILGKKIHHIGAVGAGDAVKIVNNLMLAINMAGAAEAFALGTKMGLDPQVIFDIVSASSGNSYALSAKMPNFVFKGNFTPGFTVDLQYKDLELAVQTAKDVQVPMLLTNVVQQLYEQVRAAGLGKEDISAIIKPLETLCDIQVRVKN